VSPTSIANFTTKRGGRAVTITTLTPDFTTRPIVATVAGETVPSERRRVPSRSTAATLIIAAPYQRAAKMR
jgi:hypothetical protein